MKKGKEKMEVNRDINITKGYKGIQTDIDLCALSKQLEFTNV